MGTAPLTLDHMPGAHLMQKLVSIAPDDDDQVPSLQSTHEVTPIEDDHVPALQFKQTSAVEAPSIVEKVPKSHGTQVLDEAP